MHPSRARKHLMLASNDISHSSKRHWSVLASWLQNNTSTVVTRYVHNKVQWMEKGRERRGNAFRTGVNVANQPHRICILQKKDALKCKFRGTKWKCTITSVEEEHKLSNFSCIGT